MFCKKISFLQNITSHTKQCFKKLITLSKLDCTASCYIKIYTFLRKLTLLMCNKLIIVLDHSSTLELPIVNNFVFQMKGYTNFYSVVKCRLFQRTSNSDNLEKINGEQSRLKFMGKFKNSILLMKIIFSFENNIKKN